MIGMGLLLLIIAGVLIAAIIAGQWVGVGIVYMLFGALVMYVVMRRRR